MQGRGSIKQNKAESADEQKNDFQENSVQFTYLPDEIWLWGINRHLSGKDTARLAGLNRRFNGFFQPEIVKQAAKEAAAYAIYPTAENVATLKALLNACPALLLHPVTVKNRHDMPVKGTVYQIALHEGDNELIEDVLKPAFTQLNPELDTMETQRQAWLCAGWAAAEERACAEALTAIDNVFTAFKNAADPNDVTELTYSPYTITINQPGAKAALETFRKVIDALYQPTNKVAENGRDPSMRLLDHVIARHQQNYAALGGYNTPRNNALMRAVFGYCQRFGPINFMQAFAQVPYYIVGRGEKLTRSFEYRNWKKHFILPLDADLESRLGYEHFVNLMATSGMAAYEESLRRRFQDFLSIKQQLFYNPALCNLGKSLVQ